MKNTDTLCRMNKQTTWKAWTKAMKRDHFRQNQDHLEMDKQRRLLQLNMVGLFENHFYGALALAKKGEDSSSPRKCRTTKGGHLWLKNSCGQVNWAQTIAFESGKQTLLTKDLFEKDFQGNIEIRLASTSSITKKKYSKMAKDLV